MNLSVSCYSSKVFCPMNNRPFLILFVLITILVEFSYSSKSSDNINIYKSSLLRRIVHKENNSSKKENTNDTKEIINLNNDNYNNHKRELSISSYFSEVSLDSTILYKNPLYYYSGITYTTNLSRHSNNNIKLGRDFIYLGQNEYMFFYNDISTPNESLIKAEFKTLVDNGSFVNFVTSEANNSFDDCFVTAKFESTASNELDAQLVSSVSISKDGSNYIILVASQKRIITSSGNYQFSLLLSAINNPPSIISANSLVAFDGVDTINNMLSETEQVSEIIPTIRKNMLNSLKLTPLPSTSENLVSIVVLRTNSLVSQYFLNSDLTMFTSQMILSSSGTIYSIKFDDILTTTDKHFVITAFITNQNSGTNGITLELLITSSFDIENSNSTNNSNIVLDQNSSITVTSSTEVKINRKIGAYCFIVLYNPTALVVFLFNDSNDILNSSGYVHKVIELSDSLREFEDISVKEDVNNKSIEIFLLIRDADNNINDFMIYKSSSINNDSNNNNVNCLTLIQNQKTSSSTEYCVLDCYKNQVYYESNNYCSTCPADSYNLNNQCVNETTCGSSESILSGVCKNTVFPETNNEIISIFKTNLVKINEVDSMINSESCDLSASVLVNNDCLVCYGYSLFQQFDSCVSSCFEGYSSNCDNICGEYVNYNNPLFDNNNISNMQYNYNLFTSNSLENVNESFIFSYLYSNDCSMCLKDHYFSMTESKCIDSLITPCSGVFDINDNICSCTDSRLIVNLNAGKNNNNSDHSFINFISNDKSTHYSNSCSSDVNSCPKEKAYYSVISSISSKEYLFCVDCAEGYLIDNNICVPYCSIDKANTYSNICEYCDKEQIAFNGICLSSNNNCGDNYLVKTNSEGYKFCEISYCNRGFIVDKKRNVCVTCSEYVNSSNNENEYESNDIFELNSSCVSSCPNNLISITDSTSLSESNKIVRYCSCTNSSSVILLYDTYSNSCVKECNRGYIIKEYDNNRNISACIACDESNFENDRECMAECPKGLISIQAYYNNTALIPGYCEKCDNYVEENSCVSECSLGKAGDIDEVCDYCSSIINSNDIYSKNSIYSYNNTCVEACPRGTELKRLTDTNTNEDHLYCNLCYEQNTDNNNDNISKYEYNNKCLSSCPNNEDYYYDLNYICYKDITCSNSDSLNNSYYYFIYNEECVESCPENTIKSVSAKRPSYFYCFTCTSSKPFILNNDCLSSCPVNSYVNNSNDNCKFCEKSIINLTNNGCIDSCPIGYVINKKTNRCEACSKDQVIYDDTCYNECPKYTYLTRYESNDDNISSSYCLYCSGYVDRSSNACVEKCGSNQIFNNSDRTCISCTEEYKYNSLLNKCEIECPKNTAIAGKYTSTSSSNSSNNNNTTNNTRTNSNQESLSSSLCKSCFSLGLYTYTKNHTCIEECSTTHNIVIKQKKNNLCISKEDSNNSTNNNSNNDIDTIYNSTCTEYCENNSTCYLDIDLNPYCICKNNYSGNQCQFNTTEIEQSLSQNNQLFEKLSNREISYSEYSSNSTLMNLINEMFNLVNYNKDIRNNKNLTKALSSIVEDELNDLISYDDERVSVDFLSKVDVVTDMQYKSNTYNSTKLQQTTNLVMKNLNKTESYMKRETSNSSLIYEGSVMTLQLTNNSDSEMNETISSELPYLNKTECEELLKSQEYLDNSNEILIMNLVLKNNENNKETQVQSSTLTSTLLSSSNYSSSNNKTNTNSSYTISAINSTTCTSLNALFPVTSYSQLNISLMNEIMNITGEDIFDYNSSFYSDICTIYNENESDITLQERLKKFTVYIECDNKCYYAGISNGTYAKCICESNNDINTSNTNANTTNSTYSFTSTNIKVLTNYNYHNYSSANDYYIEFNQINQLGVDDDDFFIDVSSNLFLIKCGKEAFLESNILLNIGFEVYLIITAVTIGISFCECWKNHDFIYRFKAEIKSRDWNEFCEHIVKVTKKKSKNNEIEMRDNYDKDKKINIGYNEYNNNKPNNNEGGYRFFYKSSIYENAVEKNSSCNNLTNITNINNLTNNNNVNSFLRRTSNKNANTNNTNWNSHFINHINSNNNLNNKLFLRKRKSQLLRSNSSKDLKTLSIIKLNDLTSSNNFMLSSNDQGKNKKKESIKSINSFNTHNNSNNAINIDNNPLVRDSLRNYKTNINMINSIIRNMGKRKSKFSSNSVISNSSANDSNFDSSNADLIRNKGEIEKLKNNTSTFYSKIISNASSNVSSNESKKIKKSSRELVKDRKDTNNNADYTDKSNSLIRINSIIAKNNRFSQLSKNSETNMYFIFKNRLSIQSIKSTDKSNENNDNDDNTCIEAQLRMFLPKDSNVSITNFNSNANNYNTFNSTYKSNSKDNSDCKRENTNYFTTIVEDNPEVDDVTEKKKSINNDFINNNNYYTHSQVKKISEWNINNSINEVFNINNYNSNNNNNSKANRSCLFVLNNSIDNNNSKESSRGSNNCIEEADLSVNKSKNISNNNNNNVSDEIIRRYSNNSSNNNEDTTTRNLLNTEQNTEINNETNLNLCNIKEDPNNNNRSPYYQRRKQVKNLTQKRKSNNKILRNKLSQINKQFYKYRNNKNTNTSKDKKKEDNDIDNTRIKYISQNQLENVIENNNNNGNNNANASQQTISTITSTTNNTPSIYNRNSILNYSNKNRLNTDVDDNKQSYIHSHRPLLTQIEIDNSFIGNNKELNNFKLIDNEDNNNDDDSIVKEFKLPKVFDFNSLFYNNDENIVKSNNENNRRVVNSNDDGKNDNYNNNELEFVAKSNLFKRESTNVMIDYYKNAEALDHVVVNINCNNNSRDNSFCCNYEINNNNSYTKVNNNDKIKNESENRANSTIKKIDIFKTPKKNDINNNNRNNISQLRDISQSKSNNKSIRTKSRLPTNFSISKPKLINSNEIKYKKTNNNIILETENKINLPYFQKLNFDERTHWEYFKAEVKINHIVFNLLYVKSLVEPFTIRLYDFFFELSICFALNAIFFTDSVIESRNDYKKTHFGSQLNFMFTLIEEYWKSIISSILQIIIIIIVDVIRKPGDKQKIELLNAIKSEDVERIKDNNQTFSQKMKWRYVVWYSLILLCHLFSWYYVSCFCAIYEYSSTGWLYGCLLSVLINLLISKFMLVVIKFSIRIFAKYKYAKKYPTKS